MSDDPSRNADLGRRVDSSPAANEFSMARATAAGLLPSHVGMGFSAISTENDGKLAGAIRELGTEKRQREFRLGRHCGEQALREVGWRPPDFDPADGVRVAVDGATAAAGVIGVGSDNCPLWPLGYLGSISHSRRWAWAVAAAQQHYRGIGVDTEPIVSPELRDMLQSEIGSAEEWQLMDALGLPVPLQFTLLFSAKEAYFKLWYPVTRQLLNFEDVQLQGVCEKPWETKMGAKSETTSPRIALILECQQIELEAEQASLDSTRCEVVAAWSTHDVMTVTWLANTTWPQST